ncbi:MAG: hypothetical protein J6Y25_04680 [Elusimicrobiaceae bacterium]|nr:hypothetical protein [Elusimicrobiaceae bacterium]
MGDTMAKRFTDTEKWTKQWFGNLQIKDKVLWLYVCDACNAAGIADFNPRFFSFAVGFKVTREMLKKTFGDRLYWFEENKFFIPSFIEFQYGQLSDMCKPHKPIIAELVKKGLMKVENGKGILTLTEGYRYPLERVSLPFGKGINTLQEKEKEQEQDNININNIKTTQEVSNLANTPSAFELFWKEYPKKRAGSKDKALIAFNKAIERGLTSAEQLVAKAKEYAHSEEATKNDGMYAKGAAAWLNDDRFLIRYAPAKDSGTALEEARARGNAIIKRMFGEP